MPDQIGLKAPNIYSLLSMRLSDASTRHEGNPSKSDKVEERKRREKKEKKNEGRGPTSFQKYPESEAEMHDALSLLGIEPEPEYDESFLNKCWPPAGASAASPSVIGRKHTPHASRKLNHETTGLTETEIGAYQRQTIRTRYERRQRRTNR